MISLTASASQKIKEMRSSLEDPAKAMRIFVEPGGCSGFEYGMSFDDPKEGDERYEVDGVPLLVDAQSALYLKGCEVKFDDGLQGKGFEIINPNAKSTCGCGKSFN